MSEVEQTPGRIGYDEARKAIARGQAEAFELWAIISDEHQRDGYLLRPMPWEGPGEYQHVRFADGRNGYVRLPEVGRDLPTRRTSLAKSSTQENTI